MIKMQIDNYIMEVYDKKIKLDVHPIQINDSRTMVPVRAIAEAFGKIVEWDEATKTVTIYDRKKYFDTIDDAAYDWAMHWNCMSIAVFKEMGGIIYKDDKGYYWDNIKIGKDKCVIWSIPEVRKGVAFIHSHSGGQYWTTTSMSREDFDAAKDCKRPLYMVDSGGCLWVYNPAEQKIQQKLVKKGLPKDSRFMAIENKPMKEYFLAGYHELNEYELGYKADYYNKLYLNGLNYHNERAV